MQTKPVSLDIDAVTASLRWSLESLHPFTSTPGNGTTRLPFTPEARGAVDCIRLMMQDAGLRVREDPAGNVIGMLQGEDPFLPAVVTGSHYDTVTHGGNFDGLAGIIAGIELARLLKSQGIKLKRNLVVVGFCDEEGLRFGTGYFGSKSILGQVSQRDLHRYRDKDGISVYQAMEQYGLDPDELPDAAWDLSTIHAYFEIHIEQGPLLDLKQLQIGLVECIVGIQRYMVTVTGRADHAGTTPMEMRMDAVEAAAIVISQIPGWARQKPGGTVATTGYIDVKPGGMNIVAGKVEFSVDIRSPDLAHIEDIAAKLEQTLAEACSFCRTDYKIEQKLQIEPVQLHQGMLQVAEDSCQEQGFSSMRMVSGAGHDALAMAQLLDTAMIFVPSKDGRSHCPMEWTEYSDLARAVAVAMDLVLDLQK